MVNVTIDLKDTSGYAPALGDRVIFEAKRLAGSETTPGRVITTAPVEVQLHNGVGQVDLEPGTTVMRVKARNYRDARAIEFDVPAVSRSMTLRELLEDAFTYSPAVVQEAQGYKAQAVEAARRAEAAAKVATASESIVGGHASAAEEAARRAAGSASSAVSSAQAASSAASGAASSERVAKGSADSAKADAASTAKDSREASLALGDVKELQKATQASAERVEGLEASTKGYADRAEKASVGVESVVKDAAAALEKETRGASATAKENAGLAVSASEAARGHADAAAKSAAEAAGAAEAAERAETSAASAKGSEERAAQSSASAAQSAESAKSDASRVEGIVDDIDWHGDRLLVAGKMSPSLRGPRGAKGEPGDSGASTWDAISGKPDLVTANDFNGFTSSVSTILGGKADRDHQHRMADIIDLPTVGYQRTGGTIARRLSGGQINVSDPTDGAHAATRKYVDNATADLLAAIQYHPNQGYVDEKDAATLAEAKALIETRAVVKQVTSPPTTFEPGVLYVIPE